MGTLTVIAIFDIGKTNKKLFLFNERYQIVLEESVKLGELVDDDGFPCEDIHALSSWIKSSFARVRAMKEFVIRAVNISAYGATLVHLDYSGLPFLPVCNYMKPYPAELQNQFFNNYGGEERLALETASSFAGNLNSGMQLYFLKYRRPEIFKSINWSMHLPQYLSYLISAKRCSEITSLGCHTSLWDFNRKAYHSWVLKEGIQKLLPPVCESGITEIMPDTDIAVGTGLHDSSAALVPYLKSFAEPFILISTGTWCISLNPFSNSPLTAAELKDGCLCYLTYNGKPVKASRIFAGHEHEQQVKKMSAWFNKPMDYYQTVAYNEKYITLLKQSDTGDSHLDRERSEKPDQDPVTETDFSSFHSYEHAYHQLMLDIINRQTISAGQVFGDGGIKRIFVAGGFSKNDLFMHLLARAFPEIGIYAASVSQASAIGAALVIHESWNTLPFPRQIIDLKPYYSSMQKN